MADGQRCEFINEGGRQCAVTSNLRETPTGTRCVWHDEGRLEERRRLQAKGGRTSSRRKRENEDRAVRPDQAPPEPATMEQVADWLRWTARAVATGSLGTKRGQVVVASLRELRPTLQQTELSRRLATLEAQLREVKQA